MGVIYKFTLVRYSAKQGTMHRPKLHLAHIYTVPISGREMNTDDSGVWWMISLAIVGYGRYRVAQHLLRPHLVFEPIWGWGNLGFFQLLQ